MKRLVSRSAASQVVEAMGRRGLGGAAWTGAGVGPVRLLPVTDRNTLIREGHDREGILAAITGAKAWDWADATKFVFKARNPLTGDDVTANNWVCHALNTAPSPAMSASVLRMHISNALSYAGETWLLRTGSGQNFTPLVGGVVEIVPANKGETYPTGEPKLIDGYIVRNPSTGQVISTYSEPGPLIRVHIPHPQDPMRANPPVAQAGLAIDTLHAQRMATRTLLMNDGMPAGVLQVTDEDVEDEDLTLLEQRMNSKFSDPLAKGRVLVVNSETKYTQVAQSLLGSEWSQVGKDNREDLLRTFSMPPGRLLPESDQTYETDNTELADYYRNTILPEMNLLAAEITRTIGRLLGWELYVDYSSVAALKGDQAANVSNANVLWLGDIATRNEARSIAGLPPDPTRGGVYRSDVQMELLKVRVSMGLGSQEGGTGANDDAGTAAKAGSTVGKDTTTKDPAGNPSDAQASGGKRAGGRREAPHEELSEEYASLMRELEMAVERHRPA